MAASKRVVWKGAISFGLVNIPVALHTAVSESGVDFDLLDKRTMERVGYKRINKATGEEIEPDNIVRAIAYDRQQYVVLSDEEIQSRLAHSTQTIDIESFVELADIPLVYYERPYYLSPLGQAGKAYSLLRETLVRTKRAGIARVVIHTKQHLAAIVPQGRALVLVLLRWADQIRSAEDLALPEATDLNQKELAIADQLVETMSEPWQPEKYEDRFRAQVMALVEEKARTGHIEAVKGSEAGPTGGEGAQIIDLTELLRRSLEARKKDQHARQASKRKKPGEKDKDLRRL